MKVGKLKVVNAKTKAVIYCCYAATALLDATAGPLPVFDSTEKTAHYAELV